MIEVKLPNTKPTKHSFAGTGMLRLCI